MTAVFTLGVITIYWYGIFLAIAILVGLALIEVQAKRQGIAGALIEIAAWWALIFGLIGARAYHVLTDLSLYQHDWLSTLYIWQGGLSIIGAVLGGLIGLVAGLS